MNENHITTGADTPDTPRLGKHISIIHRYSQIYLAPKLNEYGLGAGQYHFLMALYNNNGVIQERLSRIVNLDKATTARAVKKLEQQGYITRETNRDDKRSHNIFLTEKALSIRPHLEGILDSWNSVMLAGFDATENTQIMKLIQKISSNLLENCAR